MTQTGTLTLIAYFILVIGVLLLVKKYQDKIKSKPYVDFKTRERLSIESNRDKGVFGPTKNEKLGALLGYGAILLALNITFVVSSKHGALGFYFFLNIFFLALIYISFFTNNISFYDGQIISISRFWKKLQIPISDIISIKKISQPGGYGVPSPALKFELKGNKSKELNIEKWSVYETIIFLKFLKENNTSIYIDETFNPLLTAKNSEEFAIQEKIYTKTDTRAALWAGLFSLVPVVAFYILWLIIQYLKK